AKVNSLDGFISKVAFLQGYLFQKSLHHLIFILSRCAEMKIAVMAGLLAKRDVDVYTGHRCKGIAIINFLSYWFMLYKFSRKAVKICSHITLFYT
ncbi:MAG: hypothetical protein JWQ85_4066, partial [Mucilaginibacter sp.]|nr:hypothetical protein [Mucilaginibacter sp.]